MGAQRESAFYSCIVKGMEPHVDYFLLETMNSIFEVDCVLTSFETDLPIGVAMQGDFKDEETMQPRFELCEEAAKYVIRKKKEGKNIEFFFLNCASPDSTKSALEAITTKTWAKLLELGIKVGIYPNALAKLPEDYEIRNSGIQKNLSGKEYEEQILPSELRDPCVSFCLEMKETYDISIIGGCCGMFPEQIEEMSRS